MKEEDKYKPKVWAPVERITAVPAAALLVQAGLTSSDGSILHSARKRLIFDNACGNGIVTSLLLKPESKSEDLEVLCGDIAEPMIEGVKQKIADNAWNATARVLNSEVWVRYSCH